MRKSKTRWRRTHRVQHAQENIFFEGTQGELDKNQRTCRVRFYNGDKKAVITSKVVLQALQPLGCLVHRLVDRLPHLVGLLCDAGLQI